jgi:tRNA-Thr(GGU) m(6)t(6)A37 methyltransferase TsaA
MSADPNAMTVRPIGVIRSEITTRAGAPKQGDEGAPDAWIEIEPWAEDGLLGLTAGAELLVLTWLHQSDRTTLQAHPRSDPRNPLTGVFLTRSPNRPNPIGLHPVTVRSIDGRRLRVGPIEAFDGTPVVDLKSLSPIRDGQRDGKN